jgi:hypothetical protein
MLPGSQQDSSAMLAEVSRIFKNIQFKVEVETVVFESISLVKFKSQKVFIKMY